MSTHPKLTEWNNQLEPIIDQNGVVKLTPVPPLPAIVVSAVQMTVPTNINYFPDDIGSAIELPKPKKFAIDLEPPFVNKRKTKSVPVKTTNGKKPYRRLNPSVLLTRIDNEVQLIRENLNSQLTSQRRIELSLDDIEKYTEMMGEYVSDAE